MDSSRCLSAFSTSFPPTKSAIVWKRALGGGCDFSSKLYSSGLLGCLRCAPNEPHLALHLTFFFFFKEENKLFFAPFYSFSTSSAGTRQEGGEYFLLNC